MSGVDAQPDAVRQRRGLGELRERAAPRIRSVFERAGVRLGVELDPIGSHGCRPPDRIGNGVDEQADANAVRVKPPDGRLEACCGRPRLPARLTRDLARHDRHQRALIGPNLLDEIQQVRARVALDVVFDLRPLPAQRSRDVAHVAGSDVPAIRARMHGNTRRARSHAHVNRLEHARRAPAARVPQRRHLVDIDAQANHVMADG